MQKQQDCQEYMTISPQSKQNWGLENNSKGESCHIHDKMYVDKKDLVTFIAGVINSTAEVKSKK